MASSDLPPTSASAALRLDAYLAGRFEAASGPLRASRSKVQAAIRGGCVKVNGRGATKPSLSVRPGDCVECLLPAPVPLLASPEDIPLVIAYEDEHLLVVDKPAGLVVHPAPGWPGGTLVNALLHHLGLPAAEAGPAGGGAGLIPVPPDTGRGSSGDSDDYGDLLDGLDGEEEDLEEGGHHPLQSQLALLRPGPAPPIRPGLVHRLDRGTSGLLVVAKTAAVHAHLAGQFKGRTVRRVYLSIVHGEGPAPGGLLGGDRDGPDSEFKAGLGRGNGPQAQAQAQARRGRVEANVGRDPRDRQKMAVVGPGRGRPAASRWAVLGRLAGGAASLVEWRLETGRTHQIRVHARHLGCPLLGDAAYGPGAGPAGAAALAAGSGGRLSREGAEELLGGLVLPDGAARPALHAATLGFQHPATGEELDFEAALPADFAGLLRGLELAVL